MTNDPFGRSPFGFARVRVVQLPKWKLVLLSALAITVLLTLVVVAAGAFLLLFPVVLIGGLVLGIVGRWKSKASVPAPGPRATQNDRNDDIVDAEYVVITDRRRED